MKGRRTKYASHPFTRLVNRNLPQLMAADLVLVTLPDGEELIAKGFAALHGISATRQARELATIRLEAPDIEAAAALDQVLGNDGFYSNRFQTTGHA